MEPVTEREIRAAFVNCTKGEASRAHVPPDLATRPWGDLDYLGWRDPRAPARGYLVAGFDDRLQGIAVRMSSGAAGVGRKNMCSLCLTTRTGGVALAVAPRAGRSGQQGNTVGTYVCSDLQCSLYVRGKLDTGSPGVHETLTIEARAARLLGNLEDFLRRVRGTGREAPSGRT